MEKNVSSQLQELSKSLDVAELARETHDKQLEEWEKKRGELEDKISTSEDGF